MASHMREFVFSANPKPRRLLLMCEDPFALALELIDCGST